MVREAAWVMTGGLHVPEQLPFQGEFLEGSQYGCHEGFVDEGAMALLYYISVGHEGKGLIAGWVMGGGGGLGGLHQLLDPLGLGGSGGC